MSSNDYSVGDVIVFEPQSGNFPTGESTRRAEIEAFRGDEIIVRQLQDEFTKRITEDQIVR